MARTFLKLKPSNQFTLDLNDLSAIYQIQEDIGKKYRKDTYLILKKRDIQLKKLYMLRTGNECHFFN